MCVSSELGFLFLHPFSPAEDVLEKVLEMEKQLSEAEFNREKSHKHTLIQRVSLKQDGDIGDVCPGVHNFPAHYYQTSYVWSYFHANRVVQSHLICPPSFSPNYGKKKRERQWTQNGVTCAKPRVTKLRFKT